MGQYYDESRKAADRKCVICVEGKDDAVFLDHLLGVAAYDASIFRILSYGGINNFEIFFKMLLKSPGVTGGKVNSILITRDADSSADTAFNFIFNIVQRCDGVSLLRSGFSQTVSRGTHVGSFIIPDDQNSGDLETMILSRCTKPQKDLMERALSEAHLNYETLDSLNKRRAQAVIAALPGELCAGIGRAVRNGVFAVLPDDYSALLSRIDQMKDLANI